MVARPPIPIARPSVPSLDALLAGYASRLGTAPIAPGGFRLPGGAPPLSVGDPHINPHVEYPFPHAVLAETPPNPALAAALGAEAARLGTPPPLPPPPMPLARPRSANEGLNLAAPALPPVPPQGMGNWMDIFKGEPGVAIGNALSDLGAGLVTGTSFGDALGNAVQIGQQRQPGRDQAKQARALQASDRRNASFITDPALKAAVESGSMSFVDALKLQREGGSDQTANIQEYEYARRNGFTGTFQQWLSQGGESSGNNLLENAAMREALADLYGLEGAGRQRFVLTGNLPGDPAERPLTEGERRGATLTTAISGDKDTLFGDGSDANRGTWRALSELINQTPLAMFNPDAQKALGAIHSIVGSYLYTVSGATATEPEIQRLMQGVLPGIGEPLSVIAEKERRLRNYIEAIEDSAGRAAPAGGVGDLSVESVR